MATRTATITRYGEPDVRYIVPSSSLHHMKEAVATQLSPPLSSYEFDSGPEGVSLKHRETYPLRLKSAKTTVSELEDRLKTLEEAEAQRQKVSLDWEIRSRVAQAINDMYTSVVPQEAYQSLKGARHGYLPYLLATWSLANEPENSEVFVEMEEEELDQYMTKIGRLENLSDNIWLVWNAIPAIPRTLMINMWFTRSRSRSVIAHPTPTTQQALHTVQSDRSLTPEEKDLATAIIPVAVDRKGKPLFSDGN